MTRSESLVVTKQHHRQPVPADYLHYSYYSTVKMNTTEYVKSNQ